MKIKRLKRKNETFSKKINNFFKKIITLLANNIIYKKFKKTLVDYKEKKNVEKQLINLKKDFNKDFKINYEAVKALMYTINVNQPNKDYLNEKLVEGRKHVNIVKNIKDTPYFYAPEICEIHNENLNPKALTIKQLINQNDLESKNSLVLQENKISFNRDKNSFFYDGNDYESNYDNGVFENKVNQLSDILK